MLQFCQQVKANATFLVVGDVLYLGGTSASASNLTRLNLTSHDVIHGLDDVNGPVYTLGYANTSQPFLSVGGSFTAYGKNNPSVKNIIGCNVDDVKVTTCGMNFGNNNEVPTSK